MKLMIVEQMIEKIDSMEKIETSDRHLIKKLIAEKSEELEKLKSEIAEARQQVDFKLKFIKGLQKILSVRSPTSRPAKTSKDQTLQIILESDLREGISVRQMVEEYQKIGIPTYPRLLLDHVHLLIQNNLIVWKNPERQRGRKYGPPPEEVKNIIKLPMIMDESNQ